MQSFLSAHLKPTYAIFLSFTKKKTKKNKAIPKNLREECKLPEMHHHKSDCKLMLLTFLGYLVTAQTCFSQPAQPLSLPDIECGCS